MRDGPAIASALGGKRSSKGWQFRCPCHDDRVPSCSIRDDGLITCFAGCARKTVEAALDSLGFTDSRKAGVSNPKDRRRAIERAIRQAQMMWDDAQNPCIETRQYRRESLASAFRLRGITLPMPEVLRAWLDNGYICAVQRNDGIITAVQYKRSISPGSRRMTYGVLCDGAVRLAAPAEYELGIAEGIETALSATQISGIPCWATLGARRLDAVRLPDDVKRLHVFADNDDAGRDAVRRAVARYARNGRRVIVQWPPPNFNDWNDVLWGLRHESS